MTKLTENLWLYRYDLETLGVNIGRNVTVIRLESGDLVIHSTAPFSESDVLEIRSLGQPSWIVEGMVDHDTFSAKGRTAFPNIPFLAPPDLQSRLDFQIDSLEMPPEEWDTELEIIPIKGAPKMAEYVFFHHPSGTLIVCDLLFHFPEPPSFWSKLLLTLAVGKNPAPGFSKRLKMAIDDEEAFRASILKVISLPIKRIIPGHGEVLENNAGERAKQLFAKQGFLP